MVADGGNRLEDCQEVSFYSAIGFGTELTWNFVRAIGWIWMLHYDKVSHRLSTYLCDRHVSR